jgi:hypothetical protein
MSSINLRTDWNSGLHDLRAGTLVITGMPTFSNIRRSSIGLYKNKGTAYAAPQ